VRSHRTQASGGVQTHAAEIGGAATVSGVGPLAAGYYKKMLVGTKKNPGKRTREKNTPQETWPDWGPGAAEYEDDNVRRVLSHLWLGQNGGEHRGFSFLLELDQLLLVSAKVSTRHFFVCVLRFQAERRR
jgi:hypothetical protein